MNGNLFCSVARSVGEPASPFLILPEGGIVTYGDMLAASGRYANALCKLGIGKGDRVAVQTRKCTECLWLYLACLRIGAVYLPLNPAYTAAEVSYFVGDAEPALFVCEPERHDATRSRLQATADMKIATLDSTGTGTLQQSAASSPSAFRTAQLSGDDIAAILYTSGTTGRSKGAMISHENLRSNAAALVECWRFTADDVLLHALPIYHTHGLFVATNTALLSGASMLFLPKFDLDRLMDALPAATAMMGVPTFYIRLLSRADFTADLVRHIRVFISGSAPLSPDVHKAFADRTGQAILERYGMTETNMIASNPYNGPRKPGSVGLPLPGISVRIADPNSGKRLDDGEIGMIELAGPNVFRGYWRRRDKTAREFRPDGFFITGDLGFIDPDGYLNISGRDKDLIISGGLNVYPAEVESMLDAQPEISESAVIGVPHPDWGEGVTAIVVASGDNDIDSAELRNRLCGDLARYKVPQRIITVRSLPRNAMGKIQKNMLRETYRDLYGVAG